MMKKEKAELIMLGTGNAMAVECYNTCFAIRKGEEYFLVDAGGGNGIFKQLKDAHIPVTSIHHMFITHAHTDHILGMVWMIRKIASLIISGKYEGKCVIYAHKEAGEALRCLCSLTLAQKFLNCIGSGIVIQEVQDGDETEVLSMPVRFFDIGSTKMKQFGFQIEIEGKKLTCLGDEPFREVERKYAEGSDYLLCEAFCLYADKEIFKPYEKHHSTAMDAGRLAQELCVKNLLLYHTEDSNLTGRKETYTGEAAQYFTGRVYVPDDLESIIIA
ncbi:MAG: MBL fold metallo-hydrolase [Suilimivivens sp.]